MPSLSISWCTTLFAERRHPSAGWKMNITVPGKLSRIPERMLAHRAHGDVDIVSHTRA